MPDEQKPTPEADSSEPKSEDLPRQNVVEDEQTDLAVDDIARNESDEILATEDQRADQNSGAVSRSRLSRWWHNPKIRYGTVLAILIIIIVAALVKPSRFFVLNGLGFREQASLSVIDGTTKLPLQNVEIKLASQSAKTNNKGVARLKHLKFGAHNLVIQKAGFASLRRQISINLGQNSLGKIGLKAVGIQYKFKVTDYLSDKPVSDAAAKSGKSSAFSDAQGKVLLSVINRSASVVTASISAKGYKTTQVAVKFDARNKLTPISLVPAGQDVFISNANGNYDVYKFDLDGHNQKLLLAGSGNENANITLSVSPDGQQAALVDTRDNMRDASGNLLQTLSVINVASGADLTIDHAQNIQLIDWLNGRLVYQASDYSAKGTASRITSYNVAQNSRVQLDTASGFSAVFSDQGKIYYAPAGPVNSPSGFFVVNADGSGKKKLFNQQIWKIYRPNYNTLDLQTPNGWYDYNPGFQAPNQIATPPDPENYSFFVSPNGANSLWSDVRNGQGTLILHNIAASKNTTLTAAPGLGQPLRWLNNSIVIYRVATASQTADYALNINGGSPHKIVNVVNSSGANPSF
ncbi:MAG: hypothetical protein ACREGA_04175 [Candidatus Saccharimonadales bacterium]